jgi:hypothetical protein
MILAKNTYTPVSFWLSVSMADFASWIRTNNEIVNEEKDDRQHK